MLSYWDFEHSIDLKNHSFLEKRFFSKWTAPEYTMEHARPDTESLVELLFCGQNKSSAWMKGAVVSSSVFANDAAIRFNQEDSRMSESERTKHNIILCVILGN